MTYWSDAFGYESLAETMVTWLLQKTEWTEYVCYEPVTVDWNGRLYRGCRSQNFLREGEELLPLEKLYRNVTGFSLAQELAHIREVDQRIAHTVEFVENLTGIEGVGGYLSGMLEMDAADRIYGRSLYFPMGRSELWHMLEEIQETYEPAQGAPWYSSQEWKRMRAAVMDQALSYPYLFDS